MASPLEQSIEEEGRGRNRPPSEGLRAWLWACVHLEDRWG